MSGENPYSTPKANLLSGTLFHRPFLVWFSTIYLGMALFQFYVILLGAVKNGAIEILGVTVLALTLIPLMLSVVLSGFLFFRLPFTLKLLYIYLASILLSKIFFAYKSSLGINFTPFEMFHLVVTASIGAYIFNLDRRGYFKKS